MVELFGTSQFNVYVLCVHPLQDKYLHTNCLAALANMSAQFRCLHQYAAQRIIRWGHTVDVQTTEQNKGW